MNVNQQQVLQYRAEAERLRAAAATTRDPTMRQQLYDIARQYELLAVSVENLLST